MDLLQDIRNYQPVNQQEERDKELMLQYMTHHSRYLYRDDLIAHFSASAWTINRERTKALMVYNNIYDSWSWTGGHADGEADLRSVALRELREETGIRNAVLISQDIFSLEALTVNGHMKHGVYVPSHLHFNVTYLAEADEGEELAVKEDENQGVRWCTLDEVISLPKEPWMVEHIYKKLIWKTQYMKPAKESKMAISFYESMDDALLKFAVIIARTEGKYVFCKHRERNTLESPGGHREAGETILETARRELYEETGAIDFDLVPVCVYCVPPENSLDGTESFGMLYYADIRTFEKELHSEIERIVITDKLPEAWTYPKIQPQLLEEAGKRGFLK